MSFWSFGTGRLLAIIVLMGVGVVAAFGWAPGSTLESAPTQWVARELPVPRFDDLQREDGFWREQRVLRGDTLGSVLARSGVTDPSAQHFLATDHRSRALYQLRPGKAVRVKTDDDGRLMSLRYLTQSGEVLAVDRVNDEFIVQSAVPPTQIRVEMRSTEIHSSLYAAADAVDLPDAVTMQLAEVFSGDVDFYHDLRAGDTFTVLYEVRMVDGESVGTGRILGAEFVNKGVTYRAFLWHGADGSENYYAEDGRSLRRAFLRSPVAFTRIASGFSLARFHPFLQAWHAHKGVDFAAPTGTPVHASGDGNVIFAGQQNGYGNIIILQHKGPYSTAYAHLSAFGRGIHLGSHVEQGDVIGYVGQTGWATGPHLHYEFRVNNEQRDPMTIALPNTVPIAAEQRRAYAEAIAPIAAELELGQGVTLAGGE